MLHNAGKKTRPGSATISKTPREVLPLLGFILRGGEEPGSEIKKVRGTALFIYSLESLVHGELID